MGGLSEQICVCVNADQRVTSVEEDSNKQIGNVIHFVDFSQTLSQDPPPIISHGLVNKMAMEERMEFMQGCSKPDFCSSRLI